MTTRIRLQEAFKFALSMVLVYWLALWMDWDLAKYGALAVVLISLSTSGASITKGVMRVIGTVFGCVVGLIFVEWFSQARWSMMLALSSYLVFTGYFLQTSRYPYAWFVAGFLPLVIWSDTYGAVDNSFHFAAFRLLETVSGVIIYSLVSVLFWPQTSGTQFYSLGGEYLNQLGKLFRLKESTLGEQKNEDALAIQRKLDALATQLQTTLGGALNDTVLVQERKHEWKRAVSTLRALSDSMVLWRSTDQVYQRRNPEGHQTDLEQVLDIIDQRFARISELWQARQQLSKVSPGDDGPLLQKLSLDLTLPPTLTSVERGLIINRIDQLRQLDQQSRNLLLILRVVTGLDTTSTLTEQPGLMSPDRAPRWDPLRMLKSLIPAFSFIIGFLFWIFPDSPPPSGQAIAMMSGIFGLIVLLGANVRYLGLVLGAAGLLVVAPIYFVVMPWLDGGVGLLIMIFLLSFISAYLGGRWPIVKLSIMLLFVMTTGISNEQSYSFMGWMSAEFMMIIGGIIVNLVVMFMTTILPEKIMARKILIFFHNCSAVTRGFVNVAKKRRRTEYFIREMRRAPGELRALEHTLDYSPLPENARERINQLLDSFESVAARLRVVNTLVEQVRGGASSNHPVTSPLGVELPHRLHRLFERWAMSIKSSVVTEEERDSIKKLYNELEDRLETYHAEAGAPTYSEQMETDLIALLGGVRGLLDAMAETDKVVHDIHWSQWVEARI